MTCSSAGQPGGVQGPWCGSRRLAAAVTSHGNFTLLQLLHLPHFELDAGRTAEDRDRDLEPRATLVDLLDHAVEGGERPVGDAHLLAHLEGDRRLRPLDAL